MALAVSELSVNEVGFEEPADEPRIAGDAFSAFPARKRSISSSCRWLIGKVSDALLYVQVAALERWRSPYFPGSGAKQRQGAAGSVRVEALPRDRPRRQVRPL